ncbi:MAG: hypothetical protein ACXWJ4_09005 [Methyloceanibacter sp.]
MHNPTHCPHERATGEQRIRAFVFSGLREALKPYNFELTGLLRQAGLPDDTGTDGFAWVSLDRFALTLALAARATGDPCFGLKYGAAARLTSNPLAMYWPTLQTCARHSSPSFSIIAC